jgi:hypothetical protein
MSENAVPIPLDISRVKDNARLLAKWTGRPLSACQELTARAMEASSWQKLLSMETFVPDEQLVHDPFDSGPDREAERIHRQEQLLAERLEIAPPTARKLVAFWQPTAQRRSPARLFRLRDFPQPAPGPTDLAASWLKQRPAMKELLTLARNAPFFPPTNPNLPGPKYREGFFSMARDGYIFRAVLMLDLYLTVETNYGHGWMVIGDVAFGPGSIERDDRGGYMLAKYRNQAHAHLPALTEDAAFEVAKAFGLPKPGANGSTPAGVRAFFRGDAVLGLAAWLASHPRKAAQLETHSDAYMGAWPDKTMLRLEFELVHAGLLD